MVFIHQTVDKQTRICRGVYSPAKACMISYRAQDRAAAFSFTSIKEKALPVRVNVINMRKTRCALWKTRNPMLLTRNSCLIANPFACKQDFQTAELSIIHPDYSAGFLLKKTHCVQKKTYSARKWYYCFRHVFDFVFLETEEYGRQPYKRSNSEGTLETCLHTILMN